MSTPKQNNEAWSIPTTPRAWQQDALSNWLSQRKGVASIVTGGGKTLFAEMCMLAFRNAESNGLILIVVPTLALLDQWYVSLLNDVRAPAAEIAVYSGTEKPERPRAVNLMVINTARTFASAVALAGPTFIIVDECHRAGSPINSAILNAPYVATLGLSATPKRDYDDGFEQYIVPNLGPIIYEYGYDDAHKDGVITPFELVNVRIDLLPPEQEQYDKLTRAVVSERRKTLPGAPISDQIKRLLQRRAAISSAAVMRVPVAVKLAELHPKERTLIFHERIDKADLLADVLSKRHHNAAVYHTNIAPAVRRDNLRLYREGVFDVLVTCRALDEGVNVPETSVAIIASATASTRQRVQRLGRVLRPAPGKVSAAIYTLYATEHEERRLLEEADQMSEISSVSWLRGSR